MNNESDGLQQTTGCTQSHKSPVGDQLEQRVTKRKTTETRTLIRLRACFAFTLFESGLIQDEIEIFKEFSLNTITTKI